MWASFGCLSVPAWILFAQMSWDMSALPSITAAQPWPEMAAEVRDGGEVFSPDAERRGLEALERVHRRHRAPVRIEAVKSLDGAWVADVAMRRARTVRAGQLYILVAAREQDVGVIAARHGPASRLTDQQREAVRRAFLGPLREGKADESLNQGVRAIGATLDIAASPGPKPSGWEVLIWATILVVALMASRAGERKGGRGGRGDLADDLTATHGSSTARPLATGVPRVRITGGRLTPGRAD